jgi:copper chaperone
MHDVALRALSTHHALRQFDALRKPTMSTTIYQLQVKGMSCQHCVKAVTKAVQALDADASVQVELPQGAVTVQTSLTREATLKAISDEGYEVLA